jgi:cytochrome c peroxidase
LRSDRRMVKQFRAAYGHDADWPALLDAIASFERTLVTPDSRFDLWLRGDHAALTSGELAGYELFKSIGCVSCHQGVNVGGNLFEPWDAVNPRIVHDRGIFRVPSLRNIATTPPYFEGGSAPTLEVAVHRMAAAQLGRDLTDQDVASITGFLRTLTGRFNGRSVMAP